MSEFFLCPAGVQLRDEINAKFPHRDKSSDGWIGDASHAARPSEHNPCWACAGRYHGIVLATDTDVDDGDPTQDLRTMLLHELIGDPRVWYVISNQVIYSRTHGWEPRHYTGSNGHFHHVHVSFVKERSFDTQPFFGPTKPVRTRPVKLSMSKAAEEFRRVIENAPPRYSIDVARVQRLLNERLGSHLRVDGLVGERTLNQWKRLEGREGVGRPRVPDAKTLVRANRGKYHLVA